LAAAPPLRRHAGGFAEQSKARPAQACARRARWPETQFLSACVRCGLCVRDCPYKTLKLADWATGRRSARPSSRPRRAVRDVRRHPLRQGLPDRRARPQPRRHRQGEDGRGLITSRETCLNLQGLRCDVCYRVCPVIDKAITLERRTTPARQTRDLRAGGACRILHRLRQVREILRADRSGDQGAAAWPEGLALIGAGVVIAFYALVSGRAYCSWVCPINPVTDAAHWVHDRLGLNKGWQPKPNTRYFVMGAMLAASALTGVIAFELINPITAVYRAILFGGAWAIGLVAAVFLFDVFVSRRGWCSHLCPVGAAYGLIGSKSLVRVVAPKREACDDCLDCYAVCPEPHVITPALRGADKGIAPVIVGRDCTACGRCIDVCSENVFRFSHRFDTRESPAPHLTKASA
jgi:ferredoxin-type protein NapH